MIQTMPLKSVIPGIPLCLDLIRFSYFVISLYCIYKKYWNPKQKSDEQLQMWAIHARSCCSCATPAPPKLPAQKRTDCLPHFLPFFNFCSRFLRIFIAAHAAAALKKISLKRTTVSIVTRDAKIIRF